jgi:preprotein translocase subunit SecA
MNIKTLTDSELRAKSFKLQKQYEADGNLDTLIAESFALNTRSKFSYFRIKSF